MNLLELFSKTPEGARIFFGGARDMLATDHRRLMADVRTLARALTSLGIGREDRVLILVAGRREGLESILAVIGLGAIAVPVNPLAGAARVAAIVEDLCPKVVIFESPFENEVGRAIRSASAELIDIASRTASAHPGARHYHELIERFRGEFDFVDVRPHEIALMLYTSGSTSNAKRISRTHGQLSSFVRHNHLLFSQYYQPPDIPFKNSIITTLPVSHMSGLGYCLEALYSGADLYMLRSFDPVLVLQLAERSKCRFLIMIPAMYEVLLNELGRHPTVDLSSLEYCLYAGEPCPAVLAQRIGVGLGVLPVSAYGLTECLPGIGHSRADLIDRRVKLHSCGTLLFGEVLLVDEEGRRGASRGELWVRNETTPLSRAADGTCDARVTDDGWFRTGDLLSRDADGHYFHEGRVDDMFVCNGNNIYPGEVERVLRAHPNVKNACVSPISNALGHTIAAAMILAEGQMDENELLAQAREGLPRFAVPVFLRSVRELPLTAAGKLDRGAIRKELQGEYDRALRN